MNLSRFNIFHDYLYIRKVVWFCTLAVVPLWFLLGFDSGVGMMERAIVYLPLIFKGYTNQWLWQIYEVYGRSFHFSTYIIYGLLYVYLSKHLQSMGIIKTKNVVYSVCLVMLNAALFEWVYMGLFIHFQAQRSLLEWFVTDFGFLAQYMILTMLGLWGLLALISEGVGIRRDYKPFLFGQISYIAMLCLFTIWIFFPFPTTLSFNGWQSNSLFPQTHYAYINSELYIRNDLLHAVNVATKTFFAATQLFLIRGLQRK